MELTCERAVAIGLPAVIFTEHFDFDDAWRSDPADFAPHEKSLLDADGYVRLPVLDVAGYFECIDRCRHRFPELRILTGVEYGQPHLFAEQAARVLDVSTLDRVNGSLHTLQNGEDRMEPNTLYRHWPADKVITAYLEEIPRMVAGSDEFEVFTHIDYALRAWPTTDAGPFDPLRFEDGFRTAMRSIAASGRALEMNTRQLESWIPQWWSEEGGRAVTFGSDAHVPDALATRIPETMAMVEAFGFRPGSLPEDPWMR